MTVQQRLGRDTQPGDRRLGSLIDGLLSGTGSVYLINPKGVIIGKNGVVNVGGTFAASTLDVANSQFLAGGSLTFSGSSNAAVVNYGKIGALGGDVGADRRHGGEHGLDQRRQRGRAAWPPAIR